MAGVGVTAALTAGALVAFLSVATFVAFNGLPFGGSSNDTGAAYLDSSLSAAPTAAAAALGAARGAVAEDPVAGLDGAGASPRSVAAGSDPSGSSGGSGGSGPGGAQATGKAPSVGGPPDPGVSSPPDDVASPPIPIPSLPSTSGPITDGVRGVDNTVGTNLSGPTGGATRTVDGATGALDQAGRAAGRPGLGTQAGGTVSGITGSALGR